MPTNVQLNFSHVAGVTDLAVKSYAATYMRLFPNGIAPIFGLSANLKTKTAMQVVHGFYTKFASFSEMTLSGAQTNVATTLNVVSTANVLPGQIFQNFRTKEQMLILTVVNATSITVVRGYGTTAAVAINDLDYCPSIGNANEEGSARPTPSAVLPSLTTNVTQIIRNSWGVTDTARAIATIAGDGTVAESRQDCIWFHARDMENAIIFGERFETTLNGKPLRKMNGIIPSITAAAAGNITVAGATTTYDQLETALDPVFTYQSDPKMAMERVLFVGGTAMKVINKIGRLSGQYHIVDGQTSFGLQFREFKLSRGNFKMIEHPLFNSNPSWAKMALAMDFSAISLAYLTGRKTKSEEFGVGGKYVESGLDAVGGSLTTELTLEMMNPYSCGLIYNLTAAA